MMATLSRFDLWLAKGFYGIANLVSQRSSSPLGLKHTMMLFDSINNLKHALEKEVSDEDLDWSLFNSLAVLTQLIQWRGKLDPDAAAILQIHLQTLKQALERFNEFGKSGTKSVESSGPRTVLSNGPGAGCLD